MTERKQRGVWLHHCLKREEGVAHLSECVSSQRSIDSPQVVDDGGKAMKKLNLLKRGRRSRRKRDRVEIRGVEIRVERGTE